MFCQYCGTRIPSDQDICPQCRKSASADRAKSTEAEVKPTSGIYPANGVETLVLKGVNYNAKGLLGTDRIQGDLTLTDDLLAFKQWKIRMFFTLITWGALPYTRGENIRWRLSDIKSATVEKGRLLAILRICGKDGRDGVFETSARSKYFGKMESFHEALLARIARAKP